MNRGRKQPRASQAVASDKSNTASDLELLPSSIMRKRISVVSVPSLVMPALSNSHTCLMLLQRTFKVSQTHKNWWL